MSVQGTITGKFERPDATLYISLCHLTTQMPLYHFTSPHLTSYHIALTITARIAQNNKGLLHPLAPAPEEVEALVDGLRPRVRQVDVPEGAVELQVAGQRNAAVERHATRAVSVLRDDVGVHLGDAGVSPLALEHIGVGLAVGPAAAEEVSDAVEEARSPEATSAAEPLRGRFTRCQHGHQDQDEYSPS